MKTTLPARPTIVAIAVVATLLVLSLALFSPHYQTNDDVAMRLLAEGRFVPQAGPLPFMMFMNIVIGKLLATGYSLIPSIPWYDLLLGASLTIASGTLLRCWIGNATAVESASASLLALFFLLPTFVSVQFTLAGMICAAAGLALLLRSWIRPSSNSRDAAAGVILFAVGSLIRFEGAILIAVETTALAVPLILGAWQDSRQRMRGALLSGFAALALAGGFFAANQVAYRSSKGWRDFYQYNLLRARLGEYLTPERLHAQTAANLARRVGWSQTDFVLFQNWFFVDPDLYSLAKVRAAEHLFYAVSDKPARSWSKILAESMEIERDHIVEARVALLFLLIYVLFRGVSGKMILYFLWVLLVFASLILTVNLTLKAPPHRVFWPMLVMAATMLSFAAQRWSVQRPRLASILTGVCAVGVLIPAVHNLWRESESRRIAASVTRRDVEKLLQTRATMYILHGSAFPYQNYWQPLQPHETSFDFVALGVSARTPPVQEFLRKTQRTDLPWALCNDRRMLIVAEPYIMPLLQEFVAEHHRARVAFQPVFRGKLFTAWRCHRENVATGD